MKCQMSVDGFSLHKIYIYIFTIFSKQNPAVGKNYKLTNVPYLILAI